MNFAFQPLIDLADRRLWGVEALARFADGRSPLEHFAAARAAGTLADAELDAVRGVLAASTALPAGLLVTINVSGEHLEALAGSVRLDPRLRWGLELHEDSAPGSCRQARALAARMGCLLLIDDAGSGHATAARIRQAAADVVKLDRSLAGRLHEDSARELLHAARQAGARILLEGIETQAQAEQAQAAGIDYAQGYYYARPVPAADLPAAIEDLHRRVGIDVAGF